VYEIVIREETSELLRARGLANDVSGARGGFEPPSGNRVPLAGPLRLSGSYGPVYVHAGRLTDSANQLLTLSYVDGLRPPGFLKEVEQIARAGVLQEITVHLGEATPHAQDVDRTSITVRMEPSLVHRLREIMDLTLQARSIGVTCMLERDNKMIDEIEPAPYPLKARNIVQPGIQEIHDDTICDSLEVSDVIKTRNPIRSHGDEEAHVVPLARSLYSARGVTPQGAREHAATRPKRDMNKVGVTRVGRGIFEVHWRAVAHQMVLAARGRN
jgi:hypothetical protein